MALFEGLFGGGETAGLDVGGVYATLGYRHDDRNLEAWDREVDRARRDSARPIEQEIRTDYDRRGLDEYTSGTREASRTSRVLGGAAGFARRGLLFVGRAALYAGGILGVGFVLGARKAITAASDLNEAVNASNAIFERAGPTMQRWSKDAADSFGLARSEALQAASSIGAMLKPMGFAPQQASRMSQAMVELAGDMASFNNEDPSEMLERIRSGLAGESEPLRRFGVDLRVTAVEAFALKEGLIEQGEALEGAAFTQAAYQKILADTTDQQGDFARTSDGLANIQRRLRANTVDLAASMGERFTPMTERALGRLNEFVDQMERGAGAGGAFRRTIEGAVEDVGDFVSELADIATDESLAPEERVREIVSRLTDVGLEALRIAIPKIAEGAAKAAPQVALAFVDGFLNAGSWGRLAIGAWLVSKLGGWGLLRRTGAMIGGTLATGAAQGMIGGSAAASTIAAGSSIPSAAGGAAAGAGATGLVGKITGVLKSVRWARVGAAGLGIALAEQVFSSFELQARRESEDALTAIRANLVDDEKPGIAGQAIEAISGKTDDTRRAEAVEDILGTLEEMTTVRGRLTKAQEAELRAAIETVEWTDEQQVAVQRVLDTLREGRRLGIDVDLGMDPRQLQEIRRSFDLLRSGALTSLEDINKVTERNSKAIATNLGAGTKEGRRLAAENMRATAVAIAAQMQRSGDVTERGLQRIQRLMRRADLTEGLRPERFGKAWADMFTRAEGVTEDGLRAIRRRMREMPKDARQAAFDAMQLQLRELKRGGQLQGDEVRKIRSSLLAEFGELRRRAPRTTLDMIRDVVGNFGLLGNAVSTAIGLIRDNVNKGLGAFGVNPLGFVLRKVGNLLGGRQRGGKARGGFLPGVGREDTVPILAAPDEAWLTGHQQLPVEVALASSAARGEQPYGSLDELFRGDRRPHRTSRRPRRRQQGGRTVDPAWDPGSERIASYIEPDVRAWAARYNANITQGYNPGGPSVSPGHQVTGEATDVVPMAGWGSQPTALFEQGLRALEGKVPQIIYGTAGIGMALSNHGRGNHAHIEWGQGAAIAAETLGRILLGGKAGPLRDMGQAAIDRVRRAANSYMREQQRSSLAAHGPASDAGGGGFVGRIFASVSRQLDAIRKAKLALFEAGIVETGDPTLSTNPNYGDGTSRGALQLLATTAAAYGINPMDVAGVARGFLTHGYTGQGGAIELARENPGMTAGAIAQAVQGSAYPDRYDAVRDQAIAVMRAVGAQRGGRAGKSRRLGRAIARIEEIIGVREREYAQPTSAAGAELSERRDRRGRIVGGERGKLIDLNEDLLGAMLRRRRVTRGLLGATRKPLAMIEHRLRRIGALKGDAKGDELERLERERERLLRNRDRLRSQRSNQRGILTELEGLTGQGGRIFDVRDRLVELRHGDSASYAQDSTTRLNELLASELEGRYSLAALLKAQAPIFSRAFQRGGRALAGAADPFQAPGLGVKHNGGRLPMDGWFYGRKGEEVSTGLSGDLEVALEGDPAAIALLEQLVGRVVVRQLDERGRRAAASRMRPATGVVARRAR